MKEARAKTPQCKCVLASLLYLASCFLFYFSRFRNKRELITRIWRGIVSSRALPIIANIYNETTTTFIDNNRVSRVYHKFRWRSNRNWKLYLHFVLIIQILEHFYVCLFLCCSSNHLFCCCCCCCCCRYRFYLSEEEGERNAAVAAVRRRDNVGWEMIPTNNQQTITSNNSSISSDDNNNNNNNNNKINQRTDSFGSLSRGCFHFVQIW